MTGGVYMVIPLTNLIGGRLNSVLQTLESITSVCVIEVLWSETNEDFLEKKADKYHPDLFGKWILHNAKNEYVPKLIM